METLTASKSDTAVVLQERTLKRFAPPPRLKLSEWADAERILTSQSSAEYGRWRTSRTPYMREPMDVISDRQTETVVIMASSQVGKTELILNLAGYHIQVDAAPMMIVEPTKELAEALSKDRLAPMLAATPALSGIIGVKSRDGSNTLLHKTFPGGHITLSGANSAASLASRPIRILLADEVDRWPDNVGEEGDPLALAMKRTTTFLRRKIIIVSSPTIKNASRIERHWDLSDQRRFWTPCPRCRESFVLRWEHVRWENRDPATGHLLCPECEERIEDHERYAMVSAGEWRASKPFNGTAGFHIWEILSPWRSLQAQVQAFLDSRVSIETRITWTNTCLGETWEMPAEKVETGALLLRREHYAAAVPDDVEIITMGVDTQDDRLEALIIGWGRGEQSWVITRETWYGDPSQPDVWSDLDEVLATPWTRADGSVLRIQCTLVDSGGHRTQAVYSAAIPRQRERVFASKGKKGGIKGMLVSPPIPIRPKNTTGTVLLRIIDPDQVKSILLSRLRLTDPGPEYVHFPESIGENFFNELTAEELVTEKNKWGVPVKVWKQVRDRNESLDCFVMAHAALRIIAPSPAHFEKFAAQQRS